MNKIFYPLLIAAAFVFATTSCTLESPRGNRSNLQTWNVPVTAFSELYDNSSIDVEYTPSDRYSVTVTAPAKLREYVNIKVKGSTLVVSMKSFSGIIRSDGGVKVLVTAPRLRDIRLSGSGDFRAGRLSTDELSISTSGSGDIHIGTVSTTDASTLSASGSGDIRIGSLTCKDRLSLQTTGSGDLYIEADATGEVSLKTSGSGDIHATVSTTGDVGCRATGSGDISLNLRKAGLVTATTTGSGDISLSGTARSVKTHSSGSGDVYSKKLDIK